MFQNPTDRKMHFENDEMIKQRQADYKSEVLANNRSNKYVICDNLLHLLKNNLGYYGNPMLQKIRSFSFTRCFT